MNFTDAMTRANDTALAAHDSYRGVSAEDKRAMMLLLLSHTPIEHKLYQAMLFDTNAAQTNIGVFSGRRLMILTGISCYATVRRGRLGLLKKLSIEGQPDGIDGACAGQQKSFFRVFSPAEIFARRRAAGLAPYPKEIQAHAHDAAFGLAIERIARRHNLSRRKAQVALCCVEGLTNAMIGEKLHISEQTVKFHLRHVFIKFNVKRRTELIAQLLAQDSKQEGTVDL